MEGVVSGVMNEFPLLHLFGRGWLGAHRQKLHIEGNYVLYYSFGQAGINATARKIDDG
jgi:hypothetical protein